MLAQILIALAAIKCTLACDPTFNGTFKLTALNTTLPNVNDTGLPLLVAHATTGHEGKTFQLAVRYRLAFSFVSHMLKYPPDRSFIS
jgi:hypothetical protein